MKAVVFGATGMVGSEVLHHCLGNDQFEKIISVGRRRTGINHPKLQEIEHKNFIDFSDIDKFLADVDVCYYCLGVYQNQVKKSLFWEITVDYVSALIKAFEKINPDVRFCLFSAQGADQTEKAPFLFGKAKGRAERVLLDSTLSEKHIFRPGFINPGQVTPKFMWSMAIFKPIYKLLPFIGIDAEKLAEVMVTIGISGSKEQVYENSVMRRMCK
jgi:uncharacterized protein YbjT (DUF2867 family)